MCREHSTLPPIGAASLGSNRHSPFLLRDDYKYCITFLVCARWLNHHRRRQRPHKRTRTLRTVTLNRACFRYRVCAPCLLQAVTMLGAE
eukprot:51414-Eustigmatos_ZCMA.PRE.1